MKWLLKLRAWWHADILAELRRLEKCGVIAADALRADIRAIPHAEHSEKLGQIQSSLKQLSPKVPAKAEMVECPVCQTSYGVNHFPERVKHVTIVCNNPLCGEHMELTRVDSGGWRVEFRNR